MTIRNTYPIYDEVVAFGSITASFADVGTLPREFNWMRIANTTDVDLEVAIGSGSTTKEYTLPDGETLLVTDEVIREAVRVKYSSDAPSVGGFYVKCLVAKK